MSELALKLIREAKETRATRLDLGNCGLRELPDELFELTWLEELILSNEWNEYSLNKKKWKRFESQNRGVANQIFNISPKMRNLNQLKRLILSEQKYLSNLNSLQTLRNLQQLSFYATQIDDLSALKELTRLQSLDASETRVSDLVPLRALTQLRQLRIAETQVNDLSPIKRFLNLKKISLQKTQVNDLSPLEGLVNVEEIYFSDTLIDDLSPLKGLKKLKQIELSSTPVHDLSPLKELTQLKYLDISTTKVNDLSPLKELNNLQHLDLSETYVKDLNPLKSIIHKGIPVRWTKLGYGIMVQDCPLNNPPQEIVEQGNKAILNYWKQIAATTFVDYLGKTELTREQLTQFIAVVEKMVKKLNDPILLSELNINEKSITISREFLKRIDLFSLEKINKELKIDLINKTVELYEAKLIIVGEGATGKTTLFEKLKDKNHQIGNTPETHGINIHEGLPFTHTHIGDNTFHANLWDFGGQELQYMTHQFFLTPRALYVLMMDARRESPNLAYWFKIISLLGRDREDSTEKVRLLLVFNKRGNSTGTPPQYQDQLKYYADSLDVQYLEVDFAENDYRFDNLQNAIQQSLVTLPIVKSQLPRLWKAVREDLREEAKTENYIDTKRFSAICSKHGIMEEADQWLLSGYLHQLGSLLHFQNDKGLRRLVILSPQWAVDGVYTFLSEESIARNNGRFTETEFLALLARRDYNRDDADVILQLMTKNNFDICYEATEHNYVAAQLLPDNAPQYGWYPKEVLQFRYQYPIMPKGLMSRLIVRLSDDIERDEISGEQIVWKKGVVLHIKLKEGECRVRLREDDAESKAGLRQILIDVMGDRDARKYALRKVRDTVDDLHKRWFRSIKADEMVPCCCSECTISDNPQLYKLENLLKRRLKRPDTSCDVSGEDLMIQQLLEGVYDKGEIRDMENQGKYS